MLPLLLASFLSCQVADTATTAMVIHQGVGYEAVLPGSPPIIYTLMGVQAAGGVWAIHHLWKTDHKKTAVALTIGLSVAHGWAASHNAGLLR